jgi:hypothetical protein
LDEEHGKLVSSWVKWDNGQWTQESILIDRLGRFVVPGELKAENLKLVCVTTPGSISNNEIVRVEPRYKGESIVSWVCYPVKTEETRDGKSIS